MPTLKKKLCIYLSSIWNYHIGSQCKPNLELKHNVQVEFKYLMDITNFLCRDLSFERVWGWRLTPPSELPCWELESQWIPEPSENDCKSQNTLHWGFLYIIGKLWKCRCLKSARITHLDICNTSYDKKKGRETLNHEKSRIDPTFVRVGGVQHIVGNFLMKATTLLQTLSQSKVWVRSYSPAKLQEPQPWQFQDFPLGVSGQKAIWM
jgi:hypothetical protein